MKKFRKDERGSSLAMTIIAMTFISLLAVAVISMTITNIRLKQAQKGSQTNFYDADSIVDAVRAGVENLSDNSARDAYENVFAAYGALRSGGSDSLTEKYAKQYMNAMIVALSEGECDINSGASLYYKDEVIRGFLTQAQADYTGGIFVDGYKSNPGGKGTLEYDSERQTLLIKDITVVKTEKDYQTQINTDIRVNLPEMKSGINSEYLNYALLADNKVKIAGSASNATVNGCIYSGTVLRDTELDEPQAGFVVDSGATLNVNADYVVSRGDILVRAGSNMTIAGLDSTAEVWVENIETKPSSGGASGNTLSIDGKIEVSDDLEVWGDNDSVTLKGLYEGYNYNKDYSPANINKISDNANYSSAMLINGKNCTLDLYGLTEGLVLAGKTFISKKANEGESLSGAGSAYAGSRDIRTGESLTVKSSQLAYYVPKDYWKLVGTAGTTFSNPIVFTPIEGSTEQYEFDADGYNKYVNVAGFDVMDYVDATVPLSYYFRHDPSIKDDDLIYFYLNLKDDKMRDFYQIYSASSPQYSTLKDVNAKYMSSVGIRLDNSKNIITAGNILYKDSSSGKEAFSLGIENPDEGSSYANATAVNVSKQYMSLQMSLAGEYDKAYASSQYRLSDSAADEYTKSGINGTASERTNLFDVLVDRSAIENYENKGSADPNMPADSIAVVHDGDYVWDGAEKGGIIIATGEVELRKNFKGLIISGDDIRFEGATQIDADGETVEKILEADEKVYNMLSKYFRKTMAATIARGDDDSGDNEGVCYENWTKN
ncbi:MAG: hypothetical protein J1E62_01670 [Lachnospiraceae bacterium]|nr:hypothetical protein [Lachnospiraceae bacterium]